MELWVKINSRNKIPIQERHNRKAASIGGCASYRHTPFKKLPVHMLSNTKPTAGCEIMEPVMTPMLTTPATVPRKKITVPAIRLIHVASLLLSTPLTDAITLIYPRVSGNEYVAVDKNAHYKEYPADGPWRRRGLWPDIKIEQLQQGLVWLYKKKRNRNRIACPPPQSQNRGCHENNLPVSV